MVLGLCGDVWYLGFKRFVVWCLELWCEVYGVYVVVLSEYCGIWCVCVVWFVVWSVRCSRCGVSGLEYVACCYVRLEFGVCGLWC